MPEDSIITLNEDNFDEQVIKVPGPILVDFWAAWCAPCKRVAETLGELANELGDGVALATIDVDENGDLANRFGIRSIPTLIVFKNGKVVDQVVGAAPKSQIREMIDKHRA